MRFLLIPLLALGANAAEYQLKATPGTVAWGYYWSAAKPVLRIKSPGSGGDPDDADEQSGAAGGGWGEGGGHRSGVEGDLRGGEGQGAGRAHSDRADSLWKAPNRATRWRCESCNIKYSIPYAYNSFSPGQRGIDGGGFSQRRDEDYSAGCETRRGEVFRPASKFLCGPFSAAWEWRRRRLRGRVSAARRRGTHAGNLDNKDLVAGTTLFIPVHAAGALFEVGDGHAGQGNGEVDITALETSLVGTFEFVVRKDLHLKAPRGGDADAFHRDGFEPDLTEALKMAVREAIDFLVTREASFARGRLHAFECRRWISM